MARVGMVGSALVLLATAVSVRADQIGLTIVGEPQIIGSWLQRFQENGVGDYTSISVEMISGTLESPDIRNFGNPGWNLLANSPGFALASGPATTDSQFDIVFVEDVSVPISFNFFAFNGDTVKEAIRASWNTTDGWTFANTSPTAASTLPSSVPVPQAAWMGFALLAITISARAMKKPGRQSVV